MGSQFSPSMATVRNFKMHFWTQPSKAKLIRMLPMTLVEGLGIRRSADLPQAGSHGKKFKSKYIYWDIVWKHLSERTATSLFISYSLAVTAVSSFVSALGETIVQWYRRLSLKVSFQQRERLIENEESRGEISLFAFHLVLSGVSRSLGTQCRQSRKNIFSCPTINRLSRTHKIEFYNLTFNVNSKISKYCKYLLTRVLNIPLQLHF